MLPSVKCSAWLALMLAVGTSVASPVHARTSYAVKETHNVPKQWSRVGPAPSAHIIRLQIGLKQSQFSELERHLYEGNERRAVNDL